MVKGSTLNSFQRSMGANSPQLALGKCPDRAKFINKRQRVNENEFINGNHKDNSFEAFSTVVNRDHALGAHYIRRSLCTYWHTKSMALATIE